MWIAFSSQARAAHKPHTLRLPVALVVGIGLFISVIAAQTVQQSEERRERAAFQIAANQVIDAVEDRVTQHIQLVFSIASFFHSSQTVEREEFARFVADALKRNDAIQSVGWVPQVSAVNRVAVEAEAQSTGIPEYRINERTPDGRPVVAGARSEYFPTFFIEPPPENQLTYGLDQATDPVRHAALVRARDSGDLTLSGRVELRLAAENRTAVIAFAPIYWGSDVPESVEQRRRLLSGFAYGLIRPSRIVESLQNQRSGDMPMQLANVIVDVYDFTDAEKPEHLFSHALDRSVLELHEAPGHDAAATSALVRTASFGGRQWRFVARPLSQPGALAWQTWAALVGSLALTCVLAAYLQTTLSRARAIESEVSLRTNELKLTNDLLRTSEDRIRAIADSVPAMIAYVDRNLVYRFANRRYHEIGIDPDEIVGKSLAEVRGEREYEVVRRHYERAAQGEAVSFELTTVDRNGRSHFHAIDCTPDIVDGKVRGFYVLARDVTEQRRMEHELDEFFAQSLTLMCVINFDGFLSRFNPHWKTVLGYDYDELISLHFVDLVHQDDHERASAALESLVSGEDAVDLEFRMVHKDGGERSILWNAAFDDHAMQIYATGHDITTLKEVDRMKDEFVSTVSHELRTPLTSIKGALGLIRLKTATLLPPDMNAMIDIAYRNCDRLVLLINDILDIEKIEAGRMDFRLRPLDVVPVVEHAIEANQAYADQFGVNLVLSERPGHACVSGDNDRIMQVLTNLLSNAAKFSPQNGTVEIKVERREATIRISVADHGAGIPEEQRGRLFQKFSQVDSSDRRKVGGTGLGLSIVRAIVERHGGTVDYVSAVGLGTTFFVDLPEISADSSADAKLAVAAK